MRETTSQRWQSARETMVIFNFLSDDNLVPAEFIF